jgi:hypothetical protein
MESVRHLDVLCSHVFEMKVKIGGEGGWMDGLEEKKKNTRNLCSNCTGLRFTLLEAVSGLGVKSYITHKLYSGGARKLNRKYRVATCPCPISVMDLYHAELPPPPPHCLPPLPEEAF